MIINHNMNALNAHRQMAMNTVSSGKSMEKLSSGLRINRAGDDAAGLAISEKMRGQIRGLDQASRNSQDGISLIQTAEGALNETQSILQRMRELATQAANDTNAEKDREQIQNEINQLTSEINRIGNTTEFNTKKLIDGTAGSKETTPTTKKDEEAVLKALKSWWIEGGAKLVQDSYGIKVDDGTKIKVILDEGLGGTAAFVSASYKEDTGSATGITGKGSSLELHINMDAMKPLDLENNKDGGTGPMFNDRVIAHELTHAIMSQTMNFGEVETWFKEGAAEFVHGADERLKESIKLLGGIDKVVDKIGDGKTWPEDAGSHEYSAAYLAVRYLDKQIEDVGKGGTKDADGVKAIFEYLKANEDKNLSDAIAAKTDFADVDAFITAFKAAITDETTMKAKTDIDLNNADTGSVLGKDNGGAKDITAKDVIKEEGDLSDVPKGTEKIAGFDVEWPDLEGSSEGSSEGVGIKLQIGANKGQSMTVSLGDMRSEALGISKKVEETPAEGKTEGATETGKVEGTGKTEAKEVTAAKVEGKDVSAQFNQNLTSMAANKFKLNGQDVTLANVGSLNGTGTAFTIDTLAQKLQADIDAVYDGTAHNGVKFTVGKTEDGKGLTITSSVKGEESTVSIEASADTATLGLTKDATTNAEAKGTDAETGETPKEEPKGEAGTFTEKGGVTNGTNDEAVESALDVSTHENATAAIEAYDNAINTVSTQRSKLGAYQNRLEHTINNLGTSSENLTAAESRIRDVDMAKEMMAFSKNNILSQAAQAMLAQANQQPQGVLQLLR